MANLRTNPMKQLSHSITLSMEKPRGRIPLRSFPPSCHIRTRSLTQAARCWAFLTVWNRLFSVSEGRSSMRNGPLCLHLSLGQPALRATCPLPTGGFPPKRGWRERPPPRRPEDAAALPPAVCTERLQAPEVGTAAAAGLHSRGAQRTRWAAGDGSGRGASTAAAPAYHRLPAFIHAFSFAISLSPSEWKQECAWAAAERLAVSQPPRCKGGERGRRRGPAFPGKLC